MKRKHLQGDWGGDGRRTLFDEKGTACATVYQCFQEGGRFYWRLVGVGGEWIPVGDANGLSAAKAQARLAARTAGWSV